VAKKITTVLAERPGSFYTAGFMTVTCVLQCLTATLVLIEHASRLHATLSFLASRKWNSGLMIYILFLSFNMKHQ